MNRIYGILEFQELYEQTSGLMSQNLIIVENSCHSLRDRVKEERKNIANNLRTIENDETKMAAFDAALNFYDAIQCELAKLEEACHEYRVKIQADISSEILQRLQPPSHINLATVKKAYDLWNDNLFRNKDKDRGSIPKERICEWSNYSPVILQHTQDIIYGPKRLMPSEFDESDEKFKQDMMILRTKMFSMSNNCNYEARYSENITEENRLSIGTSTKEEFIETVRKSETYVPPLINVALAKVDTLKFVDGEFKASDAWMKLLDTYGQQLRSKWYLKISPRMERLLKKYRITMIHLSPTKTFEFVANIPENGSSYCPSRKDLIPLVEKETEIQWLVDSKQQLRTINGKDIAATLIQASWRGFWIRKRMFDAKTKYIAASVIWVAWIVAKKKRQMHERYLRNMLISLDLTRQLSSKLSKEYDSIVSNDHVIIHLPSAGYPLDVRRTLGTVNFGIYQNTMGLKLSFVKNPNARVIYVLPVKATDDLLAMYHDLIESVSPNNDAQQRLSFLELSQASTFANRSFNVSRTLHASEDTLLAIKQLLFNKPTFCLPWIMDECDLRIAGHFGVPLLAPDIEMQRNIFNKSWTSALIDRLGLKQPAYVNDIKDYGTLCNKLAEQICLNTEICLWLFKLNSGSTSMHSGVFLINHISIPFMPILRKERDIYGDEWNANLDTRSKFFKSLCDHLPGIVSKVTRFSKCYHSWKDFYSQMTKYGCLLQAVPNEKLSRYISVTLFVPGNLTGESPRWTGTAEKIYSARESKFFTVGYTMPQSFVNNSDLEPVVERLTDALQKDGYFGHLAVELFCFRRKEDDKIVTLVVEVKPCYEHVQHFIDWINFAINGSYDRIFNSFDADMKLLANARMQRSSMNLSYGRKESIWDETGGRYAVAIINLRHSGMSSYSWKKLDSLNKKCGIRWNNVLKKGSHLVLNDGTLKNSAMLISITSSTQSSMILIKNCLKRLYKALRDKNKINVDSNFLETIDYLDEALEDHRVSSVDKCDPLNRVR